jgi:hypothetical protein
MTPQTQAGPTSIVFTFFLPCLHVPSSCSSNPPTCLHPTAAAPACLLLRPPTASRSCRLARTSPAPPAWACRAPLSAAPPARVSPPLCHAEVRPCPASLSCRSGSAMPSVAGIGSGMVRSLGRLAGFDRNWSMVAEFCRILESPSSLR